MQALGRGYSGYYSQRDAAAEEGSAVLPRYVAPLALKPFIPDELVALLSEPRLGDGASGWFFKEIQDLANQTLGGLKFREPVVVVFELAGH